MDRQTSGADQRKYSHFEPTYLTAFSTLFCLLYNCNIHSTLLQCRGCSLRSAGTKGDDDDAQSCLSKKPTPTAASASYLMPFEVLRGWVRSLIAFPVCTCFWRKFCKPDWLSSMCHKYHLSGVASFELHHPHPQKLDEPTSNESQFIQHSTINWAKCKGAFPRGPGIFSASSLILF